MKIVILDRDGVINQDNINHIKNPNEWIPIPKSLEAITLLNQHGFYVVIATNIKEHFSHLKYSLPVDKLTPINNITHMNNRVYTSFL